MNQDKFANVYWKLVQNDENILEFALIQTHKFNQCNISSLDLKLKDTLQDQYCLKFKCLASIQKAKMKGLVKVSHILNGQL